MNKKEIEQALKDYHWMLNSIKVMQKALDSDESIRLNVTVQYGIEATLPKGKGVTGDPVAQEAIRRSKYWRRVERYEETVRNIQTRVHLITDDREKEVLHWLLEGKSYSWIARHMGLSERHIRRLKDSIVVKMSEMPRKSRKPKTSSSCS